MIIKNVHQGPFGQQTPQQPPGIFTIAGLGASPHGHYISQASHSDSYPGRTIPIDPLW